jgi:TolA-binding protein
MRYKLVLLLVIPAIFIYAQSNTESDDFSYPLKLYNQQFYDLSAQQFVKFYTGHPSSDKVPEAKYYTGMSYYKLGEFNQARIEFQSAAIEYPDSKRAGENWYKTGECYLKLNNKTEAAKAFETIRLLYPKDPLAPEATYRAGVLYLETSNTDKAQQLFRVVIDRYNSSDQYFLAMVKTAELLFQIGELQKATDLLDKVLDTKIDPQALSEAYLLLGKINLSQGDFASAKVILKRSSMNFLIPMYIQMQCISFH